MGFNYTIPVYVPNIGDQVVRVELSSKTFACHACNQFTVPHTGVICAYIGDVVPQWRRGILLSWHVVQPRPIIWVSREPVCARCANDLLWGTLWGLSKEDLPCPLRASEKK